MNRYFLPKTGWDFFDVSRAYGLGIIVHMLSGEAVISDMGGFYLIESKKKPDFERIEQIHRFLGDEQAWNWTLKTLKGKDKKTGKEKREVKKMNIIKFLSDSDFIRNILDRSKELKPPATIGSGSETLYQSMELAATKGVREYILKSYYEKKGEIKPKIYSEGSSIKVSTEDFVLSTLGHANATVWKSSGKELIFVIPTPTTTNIRHLIEIRKRVNDAVRMHRAGWFPSITQIAVNLVLEELKVKEGGKFSPKFGSLIYGVMSKTGNQWKPLTGGIFPLDFLHQIAESSVAKDVLDKWKDIFERTAIKKGYENLAVALAEFIENPSLSNYELYIKLHLRNELDRDRIKFGSYDREILEEVVNFVGI